MHLFDKAGQYQAIYNLSQGATASKESLVTEVEKKSPICP